GHSRSRGHADLAARDHHVVDRDATVTDHRCGGGAADVGEQRDDAVEPLASERGGDLLDQLVVHQSSPSPSADSSLTRNVPSTKSAAPITTAMSATLKIGQNCRSMKSITAPPILPPSRNRRSATLPSAPPAITPPATAWSFVTPGADAMRSTTATT